MTHLNYDPDAPLALPVEHTFNGIRIGYMGMYDLGFPPMEEEWIIAEGHHDHAAFIQAANALAEHERAIRPYDEKSTSDKVWAINLAKCPDLYTCENTICKRYGSWQEYADWFALWTDGNEEFTADTPGAMPVTLLDPHDWSQAFADAVNEADRKWLAENPPMTF